MSRQAKAIQFPQYYFPEDQVLTPEQVDQILRQAELPEGVSSSMVDQWLSHYRLARADYETGKAAALAAINRLSRGPSQDLELAKRNYQAGCMTPDLAFLNLRCPQYQLDARYYHPYSSRPVPVLRKGGSHHQGYHFLHPRTLICGKWGSNYPTTLDSGWALQSTQKGPLSRPLPAAHLIVQRQGTSFTWTGALYSPRTATFYLGTGSTRADELPQMPTIMGLIISDEGLTPANCIGLQPEAFSAQSTWSTRIKQRYIERRYEGDTDGPFILFQEEEHEFYVPNDIFR